MEATAREKTCPAGATPNAAGSGSGHCDVRFELSSGKNAVVVFDEIK